jgi:hypothetical protein
LGAFWLIPIVVVLLAGTWALIRLSVERTRRRDRIARAEYEDDLWAHGDARGLYGEYPPTRSGRVPNSPPAHRNIGRVRYAVRRLAERDMKYTRHTTIRLAQQEKKHIRDKTRLLPPRLSCLPPYYRCPPT